MRNLLFILSLILCSCVGHIYFETGAISVRADALSTADIARVDITITGVNIVDLTTYALVKDGSVWVGVIDDLPLGAVTVTADAYNGSDVKVYTGSNTTTVVANTLTPITVSMQQSTPPTPFTNAPPIIDSLISSSNAVKPNATINLSVTAHDPDSDPLTYSWSATGGAFNNSASQTPTWTAPGTQNNYTIMVTVSDNKGGSRTASLVINVNNANTGGSIDIIIDLNTAPVVNGLTAIPGRLNVNETTQLNLTATDPDGDPLSYSWVDTGGACAGVFNSNAIHNPTWTAPASLPGAGQCVLTCTITDGQGGSNTAAITIYVAVPDPFNLAPYLTSSYQQKTTVARNGTVKFSVNAKDPENQTMTFGWSATVGVVGTPVTHAKDSAMTWTAPNVVGPAVITVTVTDAGGAQLVKNFNVSVN
jgi:hypothetical protein